MAEEPHKAFALFVRSVKPNEAGEGGCIVPRYGLRDVWIGAHRPPLDVTEAEFNARQRVGKPRGPAGWVWTDEIVALTHAEYNAHKREYDDAIRVGSLTRVSRADFEAAQKKAEDDTKEILAKEAKAAKDAEAAAKAAKASSSQPVTKDG